jgi:hypothetical protein
MAAARAGWDVRRPGEVADGSMRRPRNSGGGGGAWSGGDGGMGRSCEIISPLPSARTADAGMRRKISSARPCSAKVIAKCTRISH